MVKKTIVAECCGSALNLPHPDPQPQDAATDPDAAEHFGERNSKKLKNLRRFAVKLL